jgi:ABC-type lipoprotein export system ATPase subunit
VDALNCFESDESAWNFPYAMEKKGFLLSNFSSLLYPFPSDGNGTMDLHFDFAPVTKAPFKDGSTVVIDIAVAKERGTLALTKVPPNVYATYFFSVKQPSSNSSTVWLVYSPQDYSGSWSPYYIKKFDNSVRLLDREFFLIAPSGWNSDGTGNEVQAPEEADPHSIEVTLEMNLPRIVDPSVAITATLPAMGGAQIFQLSDEGNAYRFPAQLQYELTGLMGDFNFSVSSGSPSQAPADKTLMSGSALQNAANGGNLTWYVTVWSTEAQKFSVKLTPIFAHLLGTPRVSCNSRGMYGVDGLDKCECVGYVGRFCDVRDERAWIQIAYVALGILLYVILAVLWGIYKKKQQAKKKSSWADGMMPLDSQNLIRDEVKGALISFADLTVPGRLHGVSGDFESGTLSIIMGGSGAGKSTLLNTLIGAIQMEEVGEVFFNGHQTSLMNHGFRDKVGLVPQFDELLEDFTVEENLRFSARLRVANLQDLEDRVDSTLYSLRLDHVRHSIVSEISGGQRRRCSIGVELVCRPAVLFLDEPTSGLDSESALVVMQMLNRLACTGQTVVAVIHQPSYEILEQVHHILIVKAGRVGFNGFGLAPLDEGGLAAAADQFCDSLPLEWSSERPEGSGGRFNFLPPGANLADWLLSQVSALNADAAVVEASHFDARHRAARRDEAMVDHVRPTTSTLPSAFWQFGVFTVQALQKLTRRVARLTLMTALVIVAACVVGIIFRDQAYTGPVGPTLASSCPQWLGNTICTLPQNDPIPNWAAILCLGVGLTSLAPATEVLLPEWDMVVKLRRSGVSVIAYFLSRMVADFPRIVVSPAIFTSIFYVFLNPLVDYARLYLIVFVTIFASAGCGYMASVVIKRAPFLAGCVVVLISVAFSGTNPPLSVLNGLAVVNWLTNLSYARWAVESLYIAEVIESAGIFNIESGLNHLSYGTNFLAPLKYLTILGFGFRFLALLPYAVPYLARVGGPSLAKLQNCFKKKKKQEEY